MTLIIAAGRPVICRGRVTRCQSGDQTAFGARSGRSFCAGQSRRAGESVRPRHGDVPRHDFSIVQPQDVEEAVRKLVELAGEGHFPAIKLLLLYTLGKPTAPLEYDQEPADGLPPPPRRGQSNPRPHRQQTGHRHGRPAATCTTNGC